MTALAALDLSHFRSYRQLALTLAPTPVALFGANGAGKTNLIEAISLLSPGRGLRRARPEALMRTQEAIGWRIRALVRGGGDPSEVMTGAQQGQSRKVEIDGKQAPQSALGIRLRVLWLVPSMDRLWLDAAAERRGFLDRITLSLTPAHGAEVLGYDKAMRERNRLLRDGITDRRWFDALEARMAGHGAALTGARRAALAALSAAGGQGDFPEAVLDLEDDTPLEAEALAAQLRDGRGRDQAAGRSLHGPHRADLAALYRAKSMPAALCSTGEQKALLISLILANARAVARTGAPPILLLDEVAAHLDADRRTALYREIEGIGGQCWMTGTEATLFEGLGPTAQRFEVVEGADGTRLEAR